MGELSCSFFLNVRFHQTFQLHGNTLVALFPKEGIDDNTSLSVVELFTDFKYNGVSKLDLRGDLMIDLIVDFLATIGDIIADIWVNKIVTKFKKK